MVVISCPLNALRDKRLPNRAKLFQTDGLRSAKLRCPLSSTGACVPVLIRNEMKRSWWNIPFDTRILANCTNGRAYATVLRLSVVCTECIVAKRCVLEQKLLLTASRKPHAGSRIWEIDWYQNEWPWPLFRGRIKVMSTMALHSTLNISETVSDRGLVPKDHQ